MSIHLAGDGFYVDILGELVPYIKYKGIPVQEVDIDSLTHNGFDNISTSSVRFISAKTKYPLVVVDEGGLLRVVDGRHRLLKLKVEGKLVAPVYIINMETLNKFKRKA